MVKAKSEKVIILEVGLDHVIKAPDGYRVRHRGGVYSVELDTEPVFRENKQFNCVCTCDAVMMNCTNVVLENKQTGVTIIDVTGFCFFCDRKVHTSLQTESWSDSEEVVKRSIGFVDYGLYYNWIAGDSGEQEPAVHYSIDVLGRCPSCAGEIVFEETGYRSSNGYGFDVYLLGSCQNLDFECNQVAVSECIKTSVIDSSFIKEARIVVIRSLKDSYLSNG